MTAKKNSGRKTYEELEERIRELEGQRKGRENLAPLPLSKLVVFYNGEDEKEDEAVLSLSDAFKAEIRRNVMNRRGGEKEEPDEAVISTEVERVFLEASPDIEVRVRMVNINHGHNKKMLFACRPLGEYAWLVAQIRKHDSAPANSGDNKKTGISEAIDKAINEMPEDFEIREFIIANRAEVKDMCLTEYRETEAMEMLRQEGLREGIRKGWKEGIQEGRKEGIQEGRKEGQQETMLLNIRNLMDSTGWTVDKIMEMLKIPVGQRTALYANLSKKA